MERQSLRRFYSRQILKGALFASTALVLPTVAPRFAFAQIAPNTTPQGGQVVGGSASIAQGNASTTINQNSENAAINWQSFNIGAAAKVQFNQPNASAIALNRVVGGNLSQINGQINANGQIILINQSGVVFGKGAQINAESVVVSTSDIATSDFMAGKLNFTGAPKPGAQIVNDGNITAKQAGLVGLVAPQVANNGLITATLGHVVLAGGAAFTLDLYGDQLISLDVTQAVRAVDIGGKLVPALVINNGAILADGGKITLTAQDADALVTQLINAGGMIRADTVGAQTGTISVQGVGGNINIAGNLLARGTEAGTKGGAVEAITTGAVSVAPGAVIDVSGNAGGGYAAIGTSIARAEAGPADKSAPKASSVDIAAGAVIHADATGHGNAGTVTVLSTDLTTFAGAITGQGGPQGGNGGLTELSSDGVINLSGTVLDTAINGQPGEILLDPATLIVTIGGASSTSASTVSPNYIDSLGGNVVLQADTLLEVLSDINMTVAHATLSLVSNQNITIEAGITVNGSLYINATDSLYIGPQLNIAGPTTVVTDVGGLSADNIVMIAGSDTQINTTITASQAVTLIGSGTLAEGSKVGKIGLPIETISGVIDSPTLTSAGFADGDVFLDNANNIGSFGDFTVAGNGTLSLTDNEALLIGDVVASNATFISGIATGPYGFSITGTVDTGTLSLDSREPVFEANTGEIDTGLLGVFGPGVQTSYTLLSTHNTIGVLQEEFLDTLALLDAHILTIASNISIAHDFLFEGIGINETGTFAINVPTFSATGIGADAELTNQNTIATLAGFSGVGSFALTDTESLQLTGNVSAGDVLLTAPTLNLQGFGLTAASGGTLALTANAVDTSAGFALAAPSGAIILAPFTATDAIDIAAGALGANTLAIGARLLGAIEASGFAALQLGGAGQSGAINLGGGALTSINLGSATLDIDTTGTIGQAAAILSLGTLAFNGDGYAEAAGATLTASLITGDGSPINGNVLLASANNAIGTIANLTISGNHDLTVLQTLALQAGNLSAATIALNTGALTLKGNISATSQATLDSSGTIFQSAGTIAAGTLTGTAASAITLGDANAFGTLAGLSAGGAILLDSSAFNIAGDISTTGTLTLEGGGATELSGSGIQAAALTSDGTAVTGAVNLAAGSNTIATLTDFAVSGANGLDLTDTGLLTVDGTVSAGNASLTADTLALNGALNVAGLLTLGSQNGLDQTGGTLNAGTLASAGAINGGGVTLAAANTIHNLAGFTVSDGDVTLNTAGTLDIIGLLNDTGSTVRFTAGGLTETGAGAIRAATLAGTGTFGEILLGSSLNQISTLEAFALTGNFALGDAEALTLDGLLSTGNGDSVSFGGVSVTEDANATIVAGTLAGAGTLSGDLLLTQANTIGLLDGLTLGGTLDLLDERNLAIGNVSAAAATFANPNPAVFNVTGFLNVAGALDLDFTGGTLEESGSITAASLVSDNPSIASAVLDGRNSIGTLGAFDAAGTFDLSDSLALTLTNDLTASGINLAGASTLDIEALVEATSFGVALAAPSVNLGAGGIILLDQSSQVFSVAADTFANTGAIIANAGTFAIAPFSDHTIDLGGITAGALDLTAAEFDIAGFDELIIGTAAGHEAQVISITAFSVSSGIGLVSLFATGLIEDDGLLDAGAIAIAGGGFTQGSGGTVTTDTLEGGGVIDGNVSLAGSLNNIGTLGPITLATGTAGIGTLTLNDQEGLTIGGGILAQDITLEDLFAIAIGAPVSVNNGGTIELIADSLSDSGYLVSAGPTGTVDIYPYTPGANIFIGGTGFFGLNLSAGLIGLISAGTLTIGTLGDAIYTVGSVSLANAQVLLTGDSLNFDGTLTGPGLLSLSTAGDITEGAGAVLDFATIAGVGGDTGLTGQNTIGTIGNFSASGNIILNDTESLVIDGLVQTSLAIELEGDYFHEIAGGTLAAATLTSGGTEIGGDVILTNANQISLLTDFFIDNGGTLDFTNGTALSVGDVTAPEATLAAPSLDVSGLLDVTGLLVLASTGDISESTGSIDAGTLASQGTIGGNADLTAENEITILSGFTLSPTGTLDLTNAIALTLAGTNVAPVTTLDAAGLDFTGDFAATTALTLRGDGNVTETGGTITTGTLGGNILGAITLLGPNLIGTLGALGATGNIAIGNAQSLDIAGLVSTAGTIALDSTAGITELAGGTLAAAVFNTGTGSIAGDLQLANGNALGTLGNVALTGNFLLSNTSALIIAGTLDTPTGDVTFIDTAGGITENGGAIIAATLDIGGTSLGGNLVLGGANTIGNLGDITLKPGASIDLADAGPLDIAGTINASAFSLFAGGIVTESGLIDAGLFSGSIAGNANLTTGQNSFGTIANLTMGAGATLDLTDQFILTLAGTILANDATLNAPALVFDGVINAGSILALTGSTVTTEGTAGDIIATTLTSDGSVDGSVFLLGTNNIGTIENFAVSQTSTFALNNGTLLTVAGPLTGGFITLSATTLDITGTIDGPNTTLTGGEITLEDTGAITAANTLELHSTAGITGGGVIDAGLLTTGLGSIAGALSLTGANSIATLGAMTVGGNALLDDAVSLTITGLVQVAGGTLALRDTAGISESGGVISAGTLTSGGAADGNVILGGQNTIAALGDFTVAAGGTLALTDTGILAVTGTVASTVLALADAGEITQTGAGLLDIGTLTSGAATDGDVFLGNTLNAIHDVGNFTIAAGDTLAVRGAGTMALTGTITAPNATFTSGGLDIDGVLNITGTLALGATGAITEATGNGGFINAATGTLFSFGTIGGPAALLTDNQIGTIGNFAVNGGFTFNDGIDYVIAGLIALPGTAALTLEGFGFRETGAGGIDAGTLTSAGATLNGNATLNGANSIATLADFAASGDIFLADSQALTLAGTISAATLGLLDASNITQTGGAIFATELTSDGGSIGAGATLTSTRNGIGTLGPFTARGGLALYDAKTLLIDGNINLGGTLALGDAQSIDQTGGTIKAAALASAGGAIGGGASFGQTGNQIAALGDFTVARNLYLNDAAGLQLTGTVAAATGLTLTATGQDITQTGGKIITALLDLTGGTIALGLANSIATLGAVSAVALDVNGVYAVTGAVNVGTGTITSPAGLAVSGDISATGDLLLSANTLAQTAGTISGAGIQLHGGAGVSLAGVLAAGTLAVTSPGVINDQAQSLTAAYAQFSGGGVTLDGANVISGALTVDAGFISQTGGYINAADITGSAAQGITLAGIINAAAVDLTAGDILETGAGNVAAGAITLTAGDIALSGTAKSSGNADLTGTDITLGGLLQATGTISIAAGGGLIETAGAEVQAGTGVWRAGFVSLAGANTFTSALNLTAAGLPMHGSTIDMSDGVLVAPTASLAADGVISLDGTARVTDDLDLKAYGQIAANGIIAAGTLTGGVTCPGELARFEGKQNHIGTIGSFVMPDSTFILNDDGPLVLDGPLVADQVTLNVNGLLTLEGSETGGLFIQGQIDPKTAIMPQPGDSVFSITGAHAGIVQTGTFFVDFGPVAGQYKGFSNAPATLFFLMSPDGNISFAPAPPDGAGLIAPSIAAVFSPGAGGTISGNADLLSLLLLNGKATNFTGMLDGLSGEAASGKGNVYPFPKPVYQFNACPIGSVNCIILPVETLPPGNPLQNFDIAQHKKKRLDKNVALPGVATRDF